MTLAANSPLDWTGQEELPGKTNYFLGNDPRLWHTNVPHFAKAQTRQSANNLGVSIYDNGENLEYDLRVPPGIDARKIRLRIAGADAKHLASNGDLLLTLGANTITIGRPAIFEDSFATPAVKRVSERRKVSGGFVLEADGSVGISVGAHDRRAGLLVDPSISVSYATFLGGSGTDTAASVAVDSLGKIYVGGTTTSASSFTENSKRIGGVDGPSEFFIAKIDPGMTGPGSLVYLTFLGGTGPQTGGLLALDASGDAAITGTTTAADFPVTGGSLPTAALTSGQGNDVIVSEIDPTGSQLVFSVFFGGTGTESVNGAGGIAMGPGGSVYIASDTNPTSLDTNSPDLPVTSGAMQTTWDGQRTDGFLAIFQPPASDGVAPVLSYCSYLGTNSTGGMYIGGIAVDSAGDVYIDGASNNSVNGFPTLKALAFEPAISAGGFDAFVMKISPTGLAATDLVYATLLGGSSSDAANAIAIDSATPPNAYIVGTTQSTDFPVARATTPGYQATLYPGAAANAFLSVIGQDSSGNATLTYSTYLGGSSNDSALGVALVPPGTGTPLAVYVAGVTTSWNFPWHDNLQPFNGAQDAFVAKFNTAVPGAASLIYATPLGGTSPSGMALTAASSVVAETGTAGNRAFVAGRTTASDFPTAITTAGTPVDGVQAVCGSCQISPPATSNSTDAFLVEIDESSTAMPSVSFNLPSLSFSPVTPGSSIVSQAVAVLNTGEMPLNISSLQIIGSQEFTIPALTESPACLAAISPAQPAGCSFQVGFAPLTAGPKHALLSVTDNAPGSPQILELSGTGEGPDAVVSPLSIAFGNQPQGIPAPQQVITVTNAGDESMNITSVAVAGANPTEFSLSANSSTTPCESITILSSQSSCTLAVGFSPQGTGPFQAQINITDNSAGGSTLQSVALIGTGTAAAPVANILPAVMALGFGSLSTQAVSAPQDVTLQNIGSAPMNISSIAITGANLADFVIVSPLNGSPCPASGGVLASGNANSTCNVGVQFAPQTAGAKVASLTFIDNAAGSPQQVSLTGTATVASVLQASPSVLPFGQQSEGTSSAAQAVTLTNNGASPAAASGVSLSGTSDFIIANPCNVVPPGKSCQVSVTFSPARSTSPGNRSATLNVPGGTPATVLLSGVATQSSISLPASFNFGSQLAGTSGTPQPLTVTNNSSGLFAGALTVTAASVSSDFAISSDSCASAQTAPGGTCTIQIAFSPQAGSSCATPSRAANLLLTDNAPGSPHSVPLSGTAMDFCFNAPGGQAVSVPIAPGAAIPPYNVQMTSSAGFTGSVGLACTPPSGVGITCSALPATVNVTPGAPGMFQITGTTTAGTTTLLPPERKFPPTASARRFALILAISLLLGAAGVSVLRSAERKPRKFAATLARLAQAGALLLGFAAGMAACGGGGGAASDPPAATPPGTYTLTVTATTTASGAAGSTQTSRTSQFTFTVN